VAFRRFSAEIEALARAWSTSAVSTDTWTPTGKSWGSNSNPIMVVNQNSLQGVAKPGSPRPDKVLRAANEKICSDLAYMLNLPIPPVTLWDRGNGFVGERYCAISAWAFAQCIEWPAAKPKLSAAQIDQAKHIAGAMKVFDTWTASSDRNDAHVLVADDGHVKSIGLAYIVVSDVFRNGTLGRIYVALYESGASSGGKLACILWLKISQALIDEHIPNSEIRNYTSLSGAKAAQPPCVPKRLPASP